MRDVRSSPPPVPEDAQWRAVNRAYAEEQKKKKDAKEARRTKKILEREKLDARRRRQKLEGLPVESSPTPSSSGSLGHDDESEVGKGTLDYLPDVREVAPGVPLGDVRLVVEDDTPETRVLGERAVSPVGSAAEVEPTTVGATPLSPRRVEEVPGSGGGQLAPVDTEAVLLPPPPPLQRRLAVPKRLHPRSQ